MTHEEPGGTEPREQAQTALQAAYEGLPPRHPWGYFHYLDGPPVAGGGVGCFAWFENRDLLWAFIARYQAWIGAPECSEVTAKKAEQVQRVIARLQAEEIDMEQARLQINELLHNFSQIECWGHADELLTSSSDFARELRTFSRLEPVDASPIPATEAQEFFCALQVYGM